MIVAYDHRIEFIPSLQKNKKTESTYSDTVIIKKSQNQSLFEATLYELKFFNNQGRNVSLYTDRVFSRTKPGQIWKFEIKSVVSFLWQSGTLMLEYIPQENFSEELLEYWTLHIVLPVFFTVEEKFDFLHAGSVEIEEKPVLFVADSFGGKSTMTDFFMGQGHTMISDDKVGSFEQEDLFYAVPSHPHHRPHRGSEDLGFFVENVASNPKPIHAIYELAKSNAQAKIEITPLYGIEKFKVLRYSSEIEIPFLKLKRFEYLSRLAKVIPVYRVTVPWDIERLDEVYQAICEHSKAI